MSNISIFKTIRQTSNGKEITIDSFLNRIKDGYWQDLIIPLRSVKDKDKRKALKTALPYVTISGTFAQRSNKTLGTHSGFIAIDIDDLGEGLDSAKELLSKDSYTYSVFTSCSGGGLCVLIKIDGEKHLQAFKGIEEYYFNEYELLIDPSCKDISRPRFVSFDPHLTINEKAQSFKKYPKKEDTKKINNIVFAGSDIDFVVKQINEKCVDITGSYQQWLNIGFALASHLGEGGRDYYHNVSQHASGYDSKLCDKQYHKCLNSNGSGVNINTFFHYAKANGIQTVQESTKKIAKIAQQAKKSAGNIEGAMYTLDKYHGIKSDEAKEIVNKVFESVTPLKIDGDNEHIITEVKNFLTGNYPDVKRNEITTRLENKGVNMKTEHFNDVWMAASIAIDKPLQYQMVERTLMSSFVKTYNPIKDYFESIAHRKPQGLIEHLSNTIQSPKEEAGNMFWYEFNRDFVKRWLVGVVSMVYGKHSPLCLMLVGHKQGTGKTEWFRRLLPAELQLYFAQSKLDRGKDDEILMCETMLILNDEYEGRTVDNEKHMKNLLSAQHFNLRAPYGRHSEKRTRIAALAATANEENVLKDTTGNRRFIPIKVDSIDFEAYNEIDKTDLWAEVYHLYKSGYDWEVKGDIISSLNDNTETFNDASMENELILKYYRIPDNEEECLKLTSSEIKVYIENTTNQKLSKRKLGLELKSLGFKNKQTRLNGNSQRRWFVLETGG